MEIESSAINYDQRTIEIRKLQAEIAKRSDNVKRGKTNRIYIVKVLFTYSGNSSLWRGLM